MNSDKGYGAGLSASIAADAVGMDWGTTANVEARIGDERKSRATQKERSRRRKLLRSKTVTFKCEPAMFDLIKLVAEACDGTKTDAIEMGIRMLAKSKGIEIDA